VARLGAFKIGLWATLFCIQSRCVGESYLLAPVGKIGRVDAFTTYQQADCTIESV
jgi:hypothetical protein